MHIRCTLTNPRRACAARVTVVGSVCVCVCVCHISPMERLFVLKLLSHIKRATKVKIFVGFSLKPFRCRDPPLPPLYSRAYSRPFFAESRHAHYSIYHVVWTKPAISSCVLLQRRRLRFSFVSFPIDHASKQGLSTM